MFSDSTECNLYSLSLYSHSTFPVRSDFECILMSISCNKGKKMRYQLNSPVSVCLRQPQCPLGEPVPRPGLGDLLSASWLSRSAVGCGRSGNLGLLFRTAAQSRMDETLQLITYRCSLRECLGSFTQFNLRHK